jgi:ubiquitin-protein ligase
MDAKTISAEVKRAKKRNNPNIRFIIFEEDANVWYFLITGLDEPYKGGEYIAKLTCLYKKNKQFPHIPPRFEMLTPNGVYDIGGPICISIGEFHMDQYRAVLGLIGFMSEVMNGLICYDTLGGGIRIRESSYEDKKLYARNSYKYNWDRYPHLMEKFVEFDEQYPNLEVVKNSKMKPPPNVESLCDEFEQIKLEAEQALELYSIVNEEDEE